MKVEHQWELHRWDIFWEIIVKDFANYFFKTAVYLCVKIFGERVFTRQAANESRKAAERQIPRQGFECLFFAAKGQTGFA